MIYFEDLASINKHKITSVVILQCTSTKNDFYYRVASLPDSDWCADFLSVDTIDEANIWCDLHNLNVMGMMNKNEWDKKNSIQ